MQHTQQLFLEALKAALKNEQVEWNNKLEAQEWMDLFRMAEVHQILPMIYEAVYRSPAAGQADPKNGSKNLPVSLSVGHRCRSWLGNSSNRCRTRPQISGDRARRIYACLPSNRETYLR